MARLLATPYLSSLTSSLSSLGDLQEVVAMVADMAAEHREAWREDPTKTSLLLLLGVLARYQAREELARYQAREELEEDSNEELEASHSQSVQAVCSKYWQHINTVGLGLRRGVALASREGLAGLLERNRLELAEELGLPEEDLLLVWVSECREERGLEEHCPDLALSLDREQKCLVLTLLGTRITPAPSVPDIVMDLRADSRAFLGGRAHSGMALGASNVLALVLDRLVEVLEGDASLSLLVTGYSLGAGLAQLVTASLLQGQEAARLPEGTRVRCLAYGAPPVYCGPQERDFREVVVVQNNMDGIIGSSVKTITDLFSKVVAIDAAEIDPNTMFSMVFGSRKDDNEDVETRTGNSEAVEEAVGANSILGSLQGALDQFKCRLQVQRETLAVGVPEEDWGRLREALEQRSRDDSGDWRLLAGTVLQMAADEGGGGGVVVRRHSGAEAAARLSGELRLHPEMYSNHMPWGYNTLFQAVEALEGVELSCLDCL